MTKPWTAPTLLPDPPAALRELRARFSGRPTSRADIRYATNFISIALASDLRRVDATAAATIWDHWRAVVQEVRVAALSGDDADPYPDNVTYWGHQLPDLATLLEDAIAGGGSLRNGRLRFRPVGSRGEPYPPWVQDLRGASGVYIIRERQPDGSTPIVYVGESHTGRLHETLTRHFQAWRRWKTFWRDQYTEGHDPGLTYERGACEAAAMTTSPADAVDFEARLIRRLRPRDNLVGNGATDDVPF
jgi:hypothetical protein